jgi:tRNA A37 threonylcarbamoyladenosine synthetase subunit TsaC/SUA5/YrdC
VFILKTLLGTEKALDIRRREAGVRIPNHPVPLRLIKTLGSPLYSITAKRSMAARGDTDEGDLFPGEEQDMPSPGGEKNERPPIPEEDLFEGGWELEDIAGVDLILDGGEERERIFSTILDLSGDEVQLLRQGAGPWPV